MSHLSVSFIATIISLWSLSNTALNASSVPATTQVNQTSSLRYLFGPSVSSDTKLVVESSSKPSHRIISTIFIETLIKLGYPNVTLKLNDGVDSVSEVLRSFRVRDRGGVPDVMVNLEILQPMGMGVVKEDLEEHSVIDAGPLGPIKFPGIYMPQSVVNEFWRSKHATIDYWRVFKNVSYASVFSSPFSGAPAKYITNPCISSNKCARLLFLKGDERYVKPLSRYINDNGLLIQPYVLNDTKTLEVILNDPFTSSRFPLLFSLHPNCLTLKYKLVRVLIPCNVMNYDSDVCIELKRRHMRKWVWNDFAKYNPYVFRLIQKISFSQSDYEALIRKVIHLNERSNSDRLDELYKQIAREWIEENKALWKKWIPSKLSKFEFVIAGLFATNGTRTISKKLIPLVERGVEIINHAYDTFSVKFEAYPVSSDNIDTVLYSYNKIIHSCNSSRIVVGIMAAIFSDMVIPIAELNNHYKIPMISPTVESLNKRNGKDFPYFFRTMPDHSSLHINLKAVFHVFNWKRLALFRQNGLLVKPQILSPLQIIYDFELEEKEILYSKKSVRKALIAAREKNARVFFVDYQERGTTLVLCMAAQLKMTPKRKYVWFLNAGYIHQPEVLREFKKMMKGYGCTDSEISEMLSTFFVLKPFGYHLWHAVKAWSYLMRGLLQTVRATKDAKTLLQNRDLIFMFDTLIIFKAAINNLIQNHSIEYLTHYLEDEKKLKTYLEHINKTDFEGFSGRMKFSDNVRQPISWFLYQFVGDDDGHIMIKSGVIKGGNFQVSKQGGLQSIARRFLNNRMPTDGSLCKWNILDYDCEMSANISVGLIIGAVVIAVIATIGCFFVFVRCYIRKMNARYSQPFAELLDALSDYEIPRSALHLQYPLGEGAFGTVYYGEMKKLDSWTGVAAKVLREGATSQERREFLCEALKMRKFHHANVMTIIGVVISDQFNINIMEFMLFGDLRKYLLPRHRLAKTDPDSQDIRPSTLTCMALDIARGLEYLQLHKLVHRDLACRNCLVNKEYRVKIGDFGMTREIDDKKAYYRFEHPGILPVRWMAPESIQSGIFNFSTDVWSYGVVLYEIVTFGNQPYRGRTNEEVIDSMKRCSDTLINYLVNPEVHIPNLFDLMRMCWSHRPEERPQISYLIGQLEVNPECVRPCLDEAPPDPGDTRPRGQGCASVFVGDAPTGRGFRNVGVSSGVAAGAGGSSFSRMISGGSRSSCDRTRFASGNRVDTDLRHCDSMGRVNTLTNSIARLGVFKDTSSAKWALNSGGGGGSKSYRYTYSQEFLPYSRHHSGDQEISTVSDPHAYQVDYDPVAFVTVNSLAANAVSNAGYGGGLSQRCSSSGGQRDDDDLDADQQTLLNSSRA